MSQGESGGESGGESIPFVHYTPRLYPYFYEESITTIKVSQGEQGILDKTAGDYIGGVCKKKGLTPDSVAG